MAESETSASRIDIWHGMSSLYLDTEIDVGTLIVLADKLASTKFSIEELDRIFFEEVHLVCCWNLALVAGEWGSFDKEWLRKEILANSNKQKPKSWLKQWQANQRAKKSDKLKEPVRCAWEKTKLLVELKRKDRIK